MTTDWIVRAAVVAGLWWAAAACSGPRPPAVVAEARNHASDARAAFAAGRHDDALAGFGRALELHRSIDDPAGIVRSLINMAVVSKAAGRNANAAVCLDAIDRYAATFEASSGVRAGGPKFVELLAEAGWMRALLEAEAGRRAAAWAELDRVRAACGPPARTLAGRFANLEARLHLDGGDAPAAAAAARRALAANRRAGDDAETADSLRLLGRATLATGNAAAALDAFSRAVDLDRSLARPSKVAEDLRGAAAAARQLGRPDQADAFAARAAMAERAAANRIPGGA